MTQSTSTIRKTSKKTMAAVVAAVDADAKPEASSSTSPNLSEAGDEQPSTPARKPIAKKAKKKRSAPRRSEEKWTKELMSGGFTIIPNALIEHQGDLGLEPIDFAIVAILAKHWWTPGDLAHPSKKGIARALKVDPRTVQRRLAALEKALLIMRLTRRRSDGGFSSNGYSLDGLIAKAKPYAIERKERRQKMRERTKPSAPGLRPSKIAASPSYTPAVGTYT